MISYSNGNFMDTTEVSLPVFEDFVGTVRGFRIFTMGKTVNQIFYRLDDHVDRLLKHAERVYMEISHSREEIKELILNTIEKNVDELGEFTILIFYSGGPANSSKVKPLKPARLYILICPDSAPPDIWYEKGIILATYPHQRQYPTVKLFNYVGGVMAHQIAVPKFNADEGLFLSPQDNDTILEGTTFGFFGVDKDNCLITHPEDGSILESITRKIILELAEKNNLSYKEIPIKKSRLDTLSETFLVSCNRGIVPVVQINDRLIEDGKPGKITKLVSNIYSQDQLEYKY